VKGLACILLGILIPAAAWAAGLHVQDSMVVTGTLTVNPDGGVASYTVRDLDKLPPAARHIVQATVPEWHFAPIVANGKPVGAKAGMSLRIVADMIDKTHARIRVASAEFGCEAGRARKLLPDECPKGSSVSYAHRRPPSYPIEALRARVGGEVFLVLQIDRSGRVSRAAARQVNLYSVTEEPAHFRTVLADASLRAASRWRFNIPVTGPEAAKDHWVVQVPVNYWMGRPGSAPARHYGEWNACIPGPVEDVPWADAGGRTSGGFDAIATAGVPFIRDTRFVLETALTRGNEHS
jgi:hypothetical protein